MVRDLGGLGLVGRTEGRAVDTGTPGCLVLGFLEEGSLGLGSGGGGGLWGMKGLTYHLETLLGLITLRGLQLAAANRD